MAKRSLACLMILVLTPACPASSWRCTDVVPARCENISLSGDYFTSVHTGELDIFHREANRWVLQQNPLPPEGIRTYSITSASLSNDVCVIAATPASPGATESVFVYRLKNGHWVQEQVIAEPNVSPGYVWDTSVYVHNDVCAVSSRYYDPAFGDQLWVHIYRFDGQRWQLEQGIADAGAAVVYGDHCALLRMSLNQGSTTQLCTYRFDGTVWRHEHDFAPVEAVDYHQFALSGDYLALSMRDAESSEDRSVVYMYVFDSLEWVQEAKLTPPAGSEPYFAGAVALSDNTLAVGPGWQLTPDAQLFIYEYVESTWTLTAQFGDLCLGAWPPPIKHFGNGLTCDGSQILAAASDYGYTDFLLTFEKCPTADLTGDCRITAADLQTMAEQWLTGKRSANTP